MLRTHQQHLVAVAKTVMIYNSFVFACMIALYTAIGFRKHFAIPDEGPLVTHLLYFTTMTHSMIGAPDIYPRTSLARLLVSLHAALVFLQIGGVLLFATTFHAKNLT